MLCIRTDFWSANKDFTLYSWPMNLALQNQCSVPCSPSWGAAVPQERRKILEKRELGAASVPGTAAAALALAPDYIEVLSLQHSATQEIRNS